MKNIVILGGGSAGWITALFVKEMFPNNEITLVEDPSTPPIIAGESGSAQFNKLLNFLGIDFDDWVIKVNAMPKLGGKLTNWNGIGTEFIHGLIPAWYSARYNAEFPSFGLSAIDFMSSAVALDIPVENIFYAASLQHNNKLPITPHTHDPMQRFNVLSMPMWHFDSRANAAFMKNKGIEKGIKLVEGKYLKSVRKDNGDIDSILLDNDRVLKADWYFDCSGFARLLLKKELGVEEKDLSNYFPASSVVAWWDETPEIKNYTGLHAMKYGWSWNINLQHRAGNGYIYDDSYISKDQAIEEIETTFNKKITPVANLKFTPSLLKEGWRNNVIAIGLSTGFLEPLESNGLSSIAEQLKAVEYFWNPDSEGGWDRKCYNQYNWEVMNDICDFLCLHYRGHRNDTDFWRDHSSNPLRVSDKLQDRLDGARNGILGIDNTQGYAIENYIIVLQGLDLINKEKLKRRLLAKRASIFDDFTKHYNIMSKEIAQINEICYTTEQWKEIMYGKS
jgi:tryptophan halogenase